MTVGGRLAGRVAIVTGGGGGLGAAIAAGYAREGATVCVADLDHARAQAAAAAIGDRAFAAAIDIAEPAQAAALIAEVTTRAGGLDILVNNAGLFGAEPWGAITAPESERLLRVNVLGLIAMSQAALPALIARGGGSIVTIASHTGLRPNPASPVYSASKAAVISLTQSLALDHAAHKVRANVIAPGAIATGMFRKGQELIGALRPHAIRPAEEAVPLGRWSDPEDYVGLAVLLASDESSYITGQTFGVNGGILLH